MDREALFRGRRKLLAGLACTAGFLVFAGGAEAAQGSLPLTAANVEQALNTPVAQQTAAQQAVIREDLQSGGQVVTTPGGLSIGPGEPAFPATSATTDAVLSPDGSGDTCFPGVLSSEAYVDHLGITLGTAGTEVGGWCEGPGKTMIVSVDGWYWPEDSPAGLCVVQDEKDHGGEGQSDGNGHTNWAHGIHVYSLGYGVGNACVASFTLEPALRIEYTGYSDNVDDWGF